MKLASGLALVVLATGLTAAAQDPICANNPQAPQCLMNGRDSTGQPLNRWDNTRTVYNDKQTESDRENAVAARKAIDDLKNTPTGAAPPVQPSHTWMTFRQRRIPQLNTEIRCRQRMLARRVLRLRPGSLALPPGTSPVVSSRWQFANTKERSTARSTTEKASRKP